MTETNQINVLLALISTFATVYAVELALSYHIRRSDLGRAAVEARGGVWDERNRIEVALDLRRSGVEAYPRLSGQYLRQIQLTIDDRTVQPLAPSMAGIQVVLCREEGQYVMYRADERGFNNPEGLWSEKSDVMVLGDSYVHGYCVADEQSLAQRLRRRWPNLLNLGVAGIGPLMQLAILKEYGPAQRPGKVIWVYYEGNDLADLVEEEANPILSAYLTPGFSQGLVRDQAALDSRLAVRVDELLDRFWDNPRDFSKGPGFVTRARAALGFANLRGLAGIGVRFPRRQALGSLPAIYREAKRTVESWGGELHVVYLPAFRRYSCWIGEGVRGRQEVLQTAARLGIAVIDLEPSFRATGEPRRLWTHPGGHLNARGYSLVADQIIAEITS